MRSLLSFLIFSQLLFIIVYSQENRTISLGPVIGATTNTTARILVEFSFSGNVTCVLNSTSGDTFNDTREVTAGDPVVFKFQNLTPATYYNVSFDPPIEDQVPSYFKTVNRTAPGNLKFGVISCNEYSVLLKKEPEADLWAHLSRKIDELQLDYLIHLGDQVYLDMGFAEDQNIFKIGVNESKPYPRAMEILDDTPREQWQEKADEIRELIKDEYRRTWNFPSVKAVLAKVPSLMILDDHEVRDDWGWRSEDWTTDTADYFYGTLAREVYYKYQRQLREDINFDNISSYEREYFYRIINNVGFYFFDYRGIRSWQRNETDLEGSQIGSKQKEFITNLLKENGTFSNVSAVFMVSTIPLVAVSEDISNAAELFYDDLQEGWINNPDDLVWLLNLMDSWKKGKAGRDIMVISGDIHMGGKSNFSRNDEFLFRQFTASSIASFPVPDVAFTVFEQIQETEQELPSDYAYKNYGWTNKYNYGLVASEVVNDEAVLDAYLVAASDDEEPEELLQDDSPIWKDVENAFEDVRKSVENIGNIFDDDDDDDNGRNGDNGGD